MANKHLLNGVIKSEPKSWNEQEIQKMLELKKEGLSFIDISKILGRTAYSCNRKFYKMMKKLDAYNDKHRKAKYDYNKQFLQSVQAENLLDVFSGGISWWKQNTDLKVIDNDIKIVGADFKLDAFAQTEASHRVPAQARPRALHSFTPASARHQQVLQRV